MSNTMIGESYTGGDSTLVYRRRIGYGGFASVHEVRYPNIVALTQALSCSYPEGVVFPPYRG